MKEQYKQVKIEFEVPFYDYEKATLKNALIKVPEANISIEFDKNDCPFIIVKDWKQIDIIVEEE